jgi:hypothetical protein
MNTVHLPSHEKTFTQYLSINSHKIALAIFEAVSGKEKKHSKLFYVV